MTTSYNEINESKFWNKKPMMKLHQNNYQSIVRKIDNLPVKNDLLILPSGYSWSRYNICDNNFDIVCKFLNDNFYDNSVNHPIITQERICWEMCDDGYFICVNDQSNNIIGTVGFTCRKLQIYDHQLDINEPMYLCSSKKYRGTKISRVLIDEAIRQSNLTGIDQGLICNNRIIGKPVSTIRQYHRALNYKKLRQHNLFSTVGDCDETVHAQMRVNLKPDKRYIVAENTDDNVNIIFDLYNQYMESFNLHMILTKEQIKNYMFNNKFATTLFVMDDDKVVDFVTYNFYDIECDNEQIKVANILMYSANKITADILITNTLKQMTHDKIHLVYLNDQMHSNEILLSNVKEANEDTDDDEVNANYDMNFIKTGKKTFINLFNIETTTFKQNMVSWFLF